MTEQEKKEIIQKLIHECKWYFDNANDYYSKTSEFKRREEQIVKPLGQQLFDTGGISLMRSVYAEVEKACGRHCRSALDMRWNGVGEWRS